jgi:hypothetical protein
MGGAGHITIAANKGVKMDLARTVDAADAYIDLERANADEQWAQIKKDNPCERIWAMYSERHAEVKTHVRRIRRCCRVHRC